MSAIIYVTMIVQILSIQSNLSTLDRYVLDNLSNAKEVEDIFEIPSYICLAQAIYESGYGTSNISKNANNHFGIKWYKRCGHDYYKSVPKGSKWRCYESVRQSYLDYGYFLDKHTTIPCFDRKQYKQWVTWVSNTGYGGKHPLKKKRYKRSLISIIEKYKLNEL